MIDDGATDWKVTQVWTFCLVDQKLIDLAQLIAMNVEEADKLNIKDMASLESAMPGMVAHLCNSATGGLVSWTPGGWDQTGRGRPC